MAKSKVSKPNDIKYLGFGFYKDYNAGGVYKAKPHEISIQKLKSRLKQLTSRSWGICTEDEISENQTTRRGMD